MSIVFNGTPQNVKYGTKDESSESVAATPAGVPIHHPIMFTFAPKGPINEAHSVSGDNLKRLYGDDVLNLKSKFTTINTPFIDLFNSNGNDMLVHRLVADDAEVASLRLFAEKLETKVPVYVRNDDGSLLYEDGMPKTDGDQDGILIVWRIGAFSSESGLFKQGRVFEGELTNASGAKSKILPILDIPAASIGSDYNNIGVRLNCLNEKSTEPLSGDYATEVGGRIMNIQFVKLTEPGASPTALQTLTGQTSVNFSFLEDAYYRPMRTELGFEDVVVPAFRNMNPLPGYIPELGPMEDIYFYRENFESLANDVLAYIDPTQVNERSDGTRMSPYMVDLFTGLDLDGNPYNGLLVDDGSYGGEVLTDRHTHYFSGGSDGTMGNDMFDRLVRTEMANFGDGAVNYLNILKYPSSWLWDAGFSTDTKEAMTTYIGRLKNTNLVLVPHVYTEGVNSMQTEEAMKIALAAMLRALPESNAYGTGCMRGHQVGHSMRIKGSAYKQHVPVSYALASKFSEYAGAGDGKFKPAKRFTRGELTVITEGYDFNLTYKPFPVYISDWEAGLMSIRSFDQYSYNFPALYTVYKDDRSILNSWIIAAIIGNLEYVSEQVWAAMSGVSDMTDSQIINMVRDKLIAATEGKYDGIVDLEFEPYFTAEDIANGNSISINIIVYGGVMKTVFKTTIISRRRVEA